MNRLELDKIENEENEKNMSKEINDLTYTLKACLYAGELFKIKHFVCQD